MVDKLFEFGYVDEENGVLTTKQIQEGCISVLSKYNVSYCYLFGSYAKGKATPMSDVDLLICTKETGLNFLV